MISYYSLLCRRVLSAAFSRTGSGRYGDKVCTVEVEIFGKDKSKDKLKTVLQNEKLANLKFH